MLERDYTKDYNIFLIRKDWDNWYTEISIGAWKPKGTRRNREMEHLIERIERLRVFS